MTQTPEFIDADYRDAPEEPSRALATTSPASLSINVEAMVARRKEFHDFIARVLKEDVHFGIPKDRDGRPIKGVPKPFLYQSGAEEIFSAFECRPRYSTVFQQLDPETGTVIMIRKCEAISMGGGNVMGEAEGSVSNDEFSMNCRYEKFSDGGHDGTITCPEHGRGRARVWNNRGGDKLVCMGKSPEPFHKVLHNALMRANKRAFVACARTLGCASEFFTQDADKVIGASVPQEERRDAEESHDTSSRSDTRGAASADTKPGDKWQDNEGNWRLHCTTHGPSKGREWDRGASLACTRRDDSKEGGWCDFKVKIDGGNELEAPLPGRTKEDIATAFARLKGAGVEGEDAKEFMVNDGYKFTERQNVTATVVKDWCLQHSKGADEWSTAVLTWFNAKYPAPPPLKAQPASKPLPFGEEPEEDELPFFDDSPDKGGHHAAAVEQAESWVAASALGIDQKIGINCPANMRGNDDFCHVYDPLSEKHCHQPVSQYSQWGKPLCEQHAAEWVRDGANLPVN